MNTDIKKAREQLSCSHATCVLCRGDEVHTSQRAGIAPMMGFIGDGTDLRGFSAADRVVGKAAAMLFALAGVKAVYGEVMSRSALPVLEKHGINYEYGTLTEYIVNRAGNGMCPMETAVSCLDDPQQGYKALREELNKLRCANESK